MRARLVAAVVAALAAGAACLGQSLSDLETERPLLMEDARPVSYRAFSGSADFTYSVRRDVSDDFGPGFSLAYGLLRGLEAGASIRWVTSPGGNAERGVSSGDLMLQTLYQLVDETAARPAIALRAGVQFPTGLDSKGTDLHLAFLATRSFDAFRLHANFRYVRLGDSNTNEKRDRLEGIAGIDFVPPGRLGITDTLLLGDVSVRSNPVVGESAIVTLEFGLRHRIGAQTIFFAGTGSEIGATHDRVRLRMRVGLTHVY